MCRDMGDATEMIKDLVDYHGPEELLRIVGVYIEEAHEREIEQLKKSVHV